MKSSPYAPVLATKGSVGPILCKRSLLIVAGEICMRATQKLKAKGFVRLDGELTSLTCFESAESVIASVMAEVLTAYPVRYTPDGRLQKLELTALASEFNPKGFATKLSRSIAFPLARYQNDAPSCDPAMLTFGHDTFPKPDPNLLAVCKSAFSMFRACLESHEQAQFHALCRVAQFQRWGLNSKRLQQNKTAIVLVGSNGKGKSAIVKLATGFVLWHRPANTFGQDDTTSFEFRSTKIFDTPASITVAHEKWFGHESGHSSEAAAFIGSLKGSTRNEEINVRAAKQAAKTVLFTGMIVMIHNPKSQDDRETAMDSVRTHLATHDAADRYEVFWINYADEPWAKEWFDFVDDMLTKEGGKLALAHAIAEWLESLRDLEIPRYLIPPEYFAARRDSARNLLVDYLETLLSLVDEIALGLKATEVVGATRCAKVAKRLEAENYVRSRLETVMGWVARDTKVCPIEIRGEGAGNLEWVPRLSVASVIRGANLFGVEPQIRQLRYPPRLREKLVEERTSSTRLVRFITSMTSDASDSLPLQHFHEKSESHEHTCHPVILSLPQRKKRDGETADEAVGVPS